jgi:hypothetical protein
MISNRWNNYRDTIVGGSAKNAGFVKRMEAEKKIAFQKISRPSKFMINKYGNKVVVEEPHYDDYADNHIDHHVEPTPLSRFDDYHVGKVPKKKVNNNRSALTEVQEERLEAEKRKKVDESHRIRDHLESLKKMVTECKTKLGKNETEYLKQLNALKSRKGLRKVQKDELQEQLIVANHQTINNIKRSFKELSEYMKRNKLTDLNLVYKHINNVLNKT